MNKRILLVDCSPKLRQATREKLEAKGYSVSLATTGADVATALEEEHFDLVLLEPVIPGLDGFKFCQGIKRDKGASAPLVVLASRIFRGGRLRTMSRDAGADAHFDRPQQDESLYAKLDELLAAQPGGTMPAAEAESPGEAAFGEFVEPPAPDSNEDEDSLTSMVPEPSFIDADSGADLAPAPVPDSEPPEFDDLSAPQPAAKSQGENVESAEEPIDLPIELDAGDAAKEEDSGLHAISEDDIDDALARALGGESGSSELGGTVFPDDLANGFGNPTPAAPQKAVDSPVAFLEDVDPQSQALPESEPSPEPAVDDEEGFALLDLDDGEDESEKPRRATAAPKVAPPASTALDDSPTTGAADADPNADSLVRSPAELDELLERAFGGQGPGQAGEPSAPTPAENTGEPPPVPDSLQGMDASTADLLSSLAELETSIPGAASGQAWQGAEAPEPSAGDEPSMPVPPPPSPEEELTLEEIFSRVSSGEEEAPAGRKEAPARGARVEEIPEPQPEEAVAATSDGEGPETKAKKRGWKKWLLGSIVVGSLAAGAAGLGLMHDSLNEAVSSTFTDRAPGEVAEATSEEPATGSDQPEQDEGDTALATLRRSLDEAVPEEQAAVSETPVPQSASNAAAQDTMPARAPETTRAKPVTASLQGAVPESAPEPREAAPQEEIAKDDASDDAQAEVLLVPLGDLDEPLDRLQAPTPQPSPAALDAGIRARAFVNVLVGSDGRVKSARTMMDPGYGLGELARQATLEWRYSVPRYEGRPAEVWKTEAVEFDATSARRR